MLGRIAIDLNQDGSCDRRITVGIQLAVQHEAELVGIYTHILTGQHLSAGDRAVAPEAFATLEMAFGQQMKSVKESFLEQAREAGVRAAWRAPKGDALEALSLHARFCDVLVMSHTRDSASRKSIVPYRADAIITSVGRPVLIVPHSGELPALGETILICWDASRSAARALSDAAPFLERAKRLIAVTVNQDKELFQAQDIMPEDLVAYCAAHRYGDLTEVSAAKPEHEIGKAILTAAQDYGCDLIVMGAYGHSPLREWAFGGTSSTLLQSMRVPVLFSH